MTTLATAQEMAPPMVMNRLEALPRESMCMRMTRPTMLTTTPKALRFVSFSFKKKWARIATHTGML